MTVPIKIALSGAHSTGKSTFLNGLAEQAQALGLRVGHVSDLATNARDKGFGILRDHTIDSTLWIMSQCMSAEAELTLRSDVILVDRPVFDAVCYLEAALECSGRSVDEARLGLVRDIALRYAAEYQWLGVTKLDFSVPLGEGRDKDSQFRRCVSQRVATWAQRLGVQRCVTTSNVETMTADVLLYLRTRDSRTV